VHLVESGELVITVLDGKPAENLALKDGTPWRVADNKNTFSFLYSG
jgi:hypothetical protein